MTSIFNRLKPIWARLTRPSSTIKTREKRQQAFLLSAVSLTLLITTLIILPPWIASIPHFMFAREFGIGFLFALSLVYSFSRTRYYFSGTIVLIATIFLLVICILVTPVGLITARVIASYFLLVGVLLTSVLLTIRATLFVTIFSVVITGVLFFIPQLPYVLTFATLVFVTVMSALIILDKSIRNRSAKQLREAEAQYRGLFDQTHDAVFIMDLQGNYLQANSCGLQLLGYTLDEIRQLNLQDTSVEYDASEDVRQRLLDGEHVPAYERLFRRKDGSLLTGEINVELVRNTEGNLRHIQAVVRDITERKRTQDEQYRQNQYLAVLHRVTLDLLNRRNRDDLLQSIINHVSEIIHAPYVEILFKEGDEMVVHACTPNIASILGDRGKRGEATLVWNAHDTKQVFTIDDYSTYPLRRDIYNNMTMTSVACFPILVGQDCVGILDLTRSEPNRPFTPEELQQGTLFAQLVAILLDNANLHDSAAREIAQRKQTEADLRTIQERQQALISAIPDLMFRFDKEGTYLDYHAPRPEMLFIPQERILGRKIADLMPPDATAMHLGMINKTLETGTESLYEFMLPIGKKLIHYEARMVVSGQNEILTIIRDITEQKRLEKRDSDFLLDMKALQGIYLELSQINDLDMLYRSMVEFTQQRLKIDRVALFLIEPDTNKLLGTYGVDTQGNIRDERYYSEVITPDHWTVEILSTPNHAKFWDDTLAHDNGQVVGRGWRTVAALWDGQTAIGYLVTDNLMNHQPARSYQDELSSLLGSTYGHLIRLKQTQISLRHNEERHRALLNAMPDLMFRFNREGVFLDYHPQQPDMLKLSSQAFLGRKMTEVLPSEIAAAQMENLSHVLETGEETIHEYSLPIREQMTTFETRMVVSGDDEVLTIVRDVSERKELEKQSFSLAVETARANVLSQFVQNASHELRTPLSTINTAVFLMAKTSDDAKRQTYADRAAGHIKQLSNLLNMVMSMTKLDSSISLNRRMIDLNAKLHRLVDASQDPVARKNLSLTFNPDQSLPLINADPAWTREALGHLLNNAIRFTPDGGSITITTYTVDHQVMVEFTDTGIGIGEEALPHIFERFWRQDEAHSTPGFGLGLSIVAKIVELHNGRIEVSSELDKGSTFKVILPTLPIG